MSLCVVVASLCSCVRRGTACWSSNGCHTPSTTLASDGGPTTTDFNTQTPNLEEPDHSGHQCQPLSLSFWYMLLCNIKTMLWVNCCYSLGYVKFSVQSCLMTNSVYVCGFFFFLIHEWFLVDLKGEEILFVSGTGSQRKHKLAQSWVHLFECCLVTPLKNMLMFSALEGKTLPKKKSGYHHHYEKHKAFGFPLTAN